MREANAHFPLAAAYALALTNAVIIGLSFSVVKIVVTQVGPIDTLAFRFVIALIALHFFARLRGIRVSFDWKNSLRLLPMGLCYPFGFFLFQGFGLLYADSGEAGILASIGPIFTAVIAAIFIRERYNFIQSFSILLSVAGVVYIAVQQGASLNNVAGVTLLLLSSLCGAGYAVLNRVLVRSISTFEIAYHLMVVGAIAFGLASFVQHAVSGTFHTAFSPFADMSFTAAILFLSVFSSLLTTVFASLALQRLTSAGLTILLNLSTVIAILVGYFCLGERIYAFHLVGATMILAGSIGTNTFPSREKT
jgi:drug/metabolite transporter (DMT)-like permease